MCYMQSSYGVYLPYLRSEDANYFIAHSLKEILENHLRGFLEDGRAGSTRNLPSNPDRCTGHIFPCTVLYLWSQLEVCNFQGKTWRINFQLIWSIASLSTVAAPCLLTPDKQQTAMHTAGGNQPEWAERTCPSTGVSVLPRLKPQTSDHRGADRDGWPLLLSPFPHCF